MTTVLSSTSASPLHPFAKKKFRTVLGFPAPFKLSPDEPPSSSNSLGLNSSLSRKSIDTAQTHGNQRRLTANRLSASNLFALLDSPPLHSTPPSSAQIDPADNTTVTRTMNALDTNMHRRPPVRVDTQDGPWSVSVAETPHDSRSYSLYIKTPTLNLTLTRTAMEIVELDQKLRETSPNVKIPPLPINADSVPPPPKRKSNFLNTLSRLASPTSNKTSRRSTNPSFGNILPTPIASPTGEINDPFTSFSASNVNSPSVVAAPSTTSTGIAAYLTTISNTPTLRQARVWKRFVRVRTDDLESVRVERAIKRVRSDLAAHVGSLSKEKDNYKGQENDHAVNGSDATVPGENLVLHGKAIGYDEAPLAQVATTPIEDSLPTPVQTPKEIQEEERDEVEPDIIDGALLEAINYDSPPVAQKGEVASKKKEGGKPSGGGAAVVTSDPTTPTVIDPEAVPASQGPGPSTAASTAGSTTGSSETAATSAPENDTSGPAASAVPDGQAAPARIHRSQSADPDKSTRLSRAFAQSAPASQLSQQEMDGASSATGDESSVSTSQGRGKKKRSRSDVPRKEKEPKKSQRKVVVNDFEMMRVLGKGCAGKVLLVKHKPTSELYALKAITKRHVLAHQELQHTLTEQAVLKRMAAEGKDPFVVKLWWSFHDKENLFLVMDFHPGGDLATQLARWGRLGRDRARFYAAEIVEGVEGLHAAGVIYRDLKPENILIGADGHIVLTDFGLSKEFPRRAMSASMPLTTEYNSSGSGGMVPQASAAWMKNGAAVGNGNDSDVSLGWSGGQGIGLMDQTSTFCGTAEYLAPEVIQGLPYSFEVDWWSFGTMLYEMLTGITPFWANNHSDMYVRVLQDELQFPEDRAIDQDTKSLIRGLLQRNPALRICEPRIKRHPYFSMIDWSHVYYKRYIPPYIPPIDPSNASDTQNFDDTFLDMEPVLDEYVDEQTTDTDQDLHTDTDRTDGEDTNTTPSQSRSSSIRPQQRQVQVQVQVEEDTVDVFDGYSFKGRHSMLLDSDDGEDTGSDAITDEDGDSSILGSIVPDTAKPETIVEEDGVEPKTPEARPIVPAEPVPEDIEELPAQEPEAKQAATVAESMQEPPLTPTDVKSRKSKEFVEVVSGAVPPPPSAKNAKDAKTVTVATPPPQQPAKAPAPRPVATRNKRRERSGIPALDKDLPDETGVETEAADMDEDDDWDFVEAVDGEERNGAKGTSLFARGVVDRYRLAVFRKASTPSRSQARTASGMSKASDATVGEDGSPSPSQRRGRTGLAFRKGPRQFLQPKTPPSSYPSKKSRKSGGSGSTNTATPSAGSSPKAGLLTPSLSMGSSMMVSPSLKSRESAASVGAQSLSSDQSGGNGDSPLAGGEVGVSGGQNDTIKGSPIIDGPEKHKTRKLKKYKEGAEKMFSLFSSTSSPRQNQA